VNRRALVDRNERLPGAGNPLFCDEPTHLVRGDGVWLFDADTNRYLDCYHDVPSVGHCHPRVVDEQSSDRSGALRSLSSVPNISGSSSSSWFSRTWRKVRVAGHAEAVLDATRDLAG
jgi:acetylornithine/succinyldiaminopimelate/putrescine aminotransferase